MKKIDSEFLGLISAQLERIENKVDRVDSRLDDSEKIQVKQEANLAEHMRRSDLLERNHDDLKAAVTPLLKVYTVGWGVCKIVGASALVVGLVTGLIKLISH